MHDNQLRTCFDEQPSFMHDDVGDRDTRNRFPLKTAKYFSPMQEI